MIKYVYFFTGPAYPPIPLPNAAFAATLSDTAFATSAFVLLLWL